MSTPRVQSFSSLRDEMMAVARGERNAPPHAADPTVHSADLIARLLTPQNRQLMMTIRDRRPDSVAHLALLTDRAPSNLTRTLDKLAAAGLVHFEIHGRQKAPRTIIGRVVIEIDPFSDIDSVRVVREKQRKPLLEKPVKSKVRAGEQRSHASKSSPRRSAITKRGGVFAKV